MNDDRQPMTPFGHPLTVIGYRAGGACKSTNQANKKAAPEGAAVF